MNLHTNKEFVVHCEQILETFLQDVDKVNFAFIATADGFAVASRFLRASEAQGQERLAAVSSSMMALGVSLAQEFGLKNCRTVTVDSDTGKILIHPIVISPEQSFTFMMQGQSESLLGMIMHSVGKLDEALIAKVREMKSRSINRPIIA